MNTLLKVEPWNLEFMDRVQEIRANTAWDAAKTHFTENIMMRNSQLLIATALFALMVASGCGSSGGSSAGSTNGGNTTGTPSTNYMPSAVGSTWTYNTVLNNVVNNGSTYNWITTYENTQYGGGTLSRKRTITASSMVTVSNMDYVLINNTWAMSSEVLYVMNNDQLMSGSSGTLTYTPAMPDFPSRTAIGTHEKYLVTITGANSGTYNRMQDLIVAGIETITVPAGTFANVLKITNSYGVTTSPPSFSAWYAEGIGLIKSVQITSMTTGTTTTYGSKTDELTSYNVL